MTEKASFRTVASSMLYSLVISWAVAILILGILSIPAILHILPDALKIKNLSSTTSVGDVVRPTIEQLGNLPHIATISTFIFWCLAGSIVYIAGISLYDILFTARNTIDEARHYLFPVSVKRSTVVQTSLLNWVVFAMLILITVSLIISVLFLLLPVCRELFMSGLRKPHQLYAWLHTVASSLSLAILFSASVFLIRLVKRSFSIL